MTRHVRQPKRADATAQELAALHAELRELRALIEQRLPAVPAPESDPPIGVVAASQISGTSAKRLRRLIDRGAPIGEYNAATDRYLVRMGALSAYLAANGEATPAGLKG